MKTMNKVIAAMMMMAITTAMPAMAGNKNHTNNDKKDKVVAVNIGKKVSHFDKVDKKTTHFNTHKKNTYRPDVKTYTFKVSRHDSYKKVVAKAERIDGVMDAKWNARTREVTIRYDANKTSVKYIKHSVA
ncbi:MAG: hypothetical protein J5658_14015 [Prevotella sp.]|nr:hypothetical protein [Prevotella sp.]